MTSIIPLHELNEISKVKSTEKQQSIAIKVSPSESN